MAFDLEHYTAKIAELDCMTYEGEIKRVSGSVIEARGPANHRDHLGVDARAQRSLLEQRRAVHRTRGFRRTHSTRHAWLERPPVDPRQRRRVDARVPDRRARKKKCFEKTPNK